MNAINDKMIWIERVLSTNWRCLACVSGGQLLSDIRIGMTKGRREEKERHQGGLECGLEV